MLFAVVSEMLNEAERRSGGPAAPARGRSSSPFQTTPLRSIDFLLPGILAMALMQLGFFGSFQIVSLREQKVLKALGATPLPRSYVLGAEVLVRLLLVARAARADVAIGVASSACTSSATGSRCSASSPSGR